MVRRGSYRMVIGFTTTYAISAYHPLFNEHQRQGYGV
jgi:hypothetical protein